MEVEPEVEEVAAEATAWLEQEDSDLQAMNPHMAPGGSKTAPSQLVAKERAFRALSLRRSGVSYEEIAKNLGYASAKSAGQAVRRLLKAQERDEVQDYLAISEERLQHWLMVLSPRANQGDERAIELSMRIMEKMDRLRGVNEETLTVKHEHQHALVVVDGDETDYVRAMQKMAAHDPEQLNPGQGALPAAVPSEAFPDAVDAELVEEDQDATQDDTTSVLDLPDVVEEAPLSGD